MTDERKPDLLVPDRSIVSIEEAKRELSEKADRKPGSPGHDFVTRKQLLKVMDRIADGITDASLAVGAKMYDQASEELAENFEDLARQVRQMIRAEFERRTLWGRLKLWWRARNAPSGPRLVDAVDALDPNAVLHEHGATEAG